MEVTPRPWRWPSILTLVLALAVSPIASCDSPTSPLESCDLSTLPGAPYAYACPQDVGLRNEDLDAVWDQMQRWVTEGWIVGGELMLVKDDRIAFHRADGWSDRERGIPLERNSIYRVRSMTKPFVGTSILVLYEEGRLGLDDRISSYLPSWDNPRSGEITIRQLLTHTGGFAHVRDSPWPKPFYEYESLRAAVDEIGVIGPHHPPGSGYRYADKGTATLGAVVAEISGMTLERFIETRILEPLGLADSFTRFTPAAPWAPRMNSTYRWNETAWEKYWDNTMDQVYPFFRGCGGLYSTVFDYARFLGAWMDGGLYPGGRLLSESTVHAAFESRVPAGETGYGFQWRIWSPEVPVPGQLPTFGHAGKDGTLAIAVPHRNAMLFYFTQSSGNPTRDPLGEWVMEILDSSF
jgi:CubicO group peptidase (beta-lactamase class C family)